MAKRSESSILLYARNWPPRRWNTSAESHLHLIKIPLHLSAGNSHNCWLKHLYRCLVYLSDLHLSPSLPLSLSLSLSLSLPLPHIHYRNIITSFWYIAQALGTLLNAGIAQIPGLTLLKEFFTYMALMFVVTFVFVLINWQYQYRSNKEDQRTIAE